MDPLNDPTVYEGLLALLQNEFPKICARCGRSYPTLESFVDETSPVETGTGLMGYDLGGDSRSVAMMRNCSCGSTLASFCCDRRDTSEGGLRRRDLFENLLAQLQSSGVDPLQARDQLLAFLRGERSPLLERFGFFARPRSLQPNS